MSSTNENWATSITPSFTGAAIVSLVGGPGQINRCLDVSHGDIVVDGLAGLYRCFSGDNAQEWTAVIGPA
jgi:hypothetical protein